MRVQAHHGELFFCAYLMQAPHQPQNVDHYINGLERRGLVIGERPKAEHYLQRIGYYRLEEYIQPFEIDRPERRHLVTFDNVLELYKFDRQLRLLTLDALERVEIALKNDLHRHLSSTYGENWFASRAYKIPTDIRDSIQRFIEKRRTPNPTSGAVLEPANGVDAIRAMGFGHAARLYKMLPNKVKDGIAKGYGTRYVVLEPSLRALNTVRNISAHHDRLWNVRFITKPKMPDPVVAQFGYVRVKPNFDERYYAQTLVLYFLLRQIARNSMWHTRLNRLLSENAQKIQNVDLLRRMGFPRRWTEKPFWNEHYPIAGPA